MFLAGVSVLQTLAFIVTLAGVYFTRGTALIFSSVLTVVTMSTTTAYCISRISDANDQKIISRKYRVCVRERESV